MGISSAFNKTTTATGFRSGDFNTEMQDSQNKYNIGAIHASLTTGTDGHIVNTALTGRKRPLNLVHKKNGLRPSHVEES